MTLWICWTIVASALIAAAAAALDRAAALANVPRRLVWMAAIIATVVAPITLGVRQMPASSGVSSPSIATPLSSSQGDAASSLSSSAALPGSVAPSTARTRLTSWHFPSSETLESLTASAKRADPWVLRAWLAASLFLALLLTRDLVRLRSRRSTWGVTDTEIGPVHVAPDVGPAVCGVLRPRVVIPRWVLGLEGTSKTLMLRHELEHVRAGDTRLLFAAELALVLLPWNVVVRWMVRRLRLAIEMDCDSRVIRRVADAHDYASMLLSVGERYATGLPLAVSLLESRLELEERVNAIAATRQRRSRAACLPLLVVAGIALATVGWAPRPSSLRLARTIPPTVKCGMPLAAPPDKISAARRHIPSAPSETILAHAAPLPLPVETPPVLPGASASAPITYVDGIRGTPPDDSILAAVGYLERRAAGHAFFIDGHQINHEAASFSDVVRVRSAIGNSDTRVYDRPRLIITQRADGQSYAIVDARDMSGCVAAFVDGSLFSSSDPGDIDQFVKPSDLLAIEAYRPSEAPSRFATPDDGKCVTILVWTRNWTKRG